MNTYQNIFNMIIISLCLLMSGTIAYLVDINHRLEGQVFELDNVQERESHNKAERGYLAQSILELKDEYQKSVRIFEDEVSSLRDKNKSNVERINTSYMHINQIYNKLGELHPEFKDESKKITDELMGNTSSPTVEEINKDIENQLKALDKEIENAK